MLTNVPGFTQNEFRVAASTAASAAANGKTSFKFFTGLVEEVRNQDLDPEQVKQGVLFFPPGATQRSRTWRTDP